MSFIGDAIKLGLNADGEILRIVKKFLLSYETVAGTSGSTTLDLKVNVHFLTTTSGQAAFDLATGKTGQVKLIVLKTKSTSSAVIAATFGGGTALTLDTTGKSSLIVFDGTSWQVAGNYGGSVA